MTKQVEVAIIGAGSAGLAARAEVAKQTDDYVVIDGGALGTTCARVGCMPSKALIQVAHAIEAQKRLEAQGIVSARQDAVDAVQIMRHVRRLRDRFVAGVMSGMEAWQDRLIRKRARFADRHTLDLGDETIRADKIIIATGSTPIVPKSWMPYREYLIDTDGFFDLETLPRSLAVIGLGPIGIELGQALSRLGVDVVAINLDKAIGGLTDPELQDVAWDCYSQDLEMRVGSAELHGVQGGKIRVGCRDEVWPVDRVLLAMGRRPAVQGLGLENLNVSLDERGIPVFDPATGRIGDLGVFIAGDVNGVRPILHEAADEGRIAGFNAMADQVTCFQKRVPLGITFCDPNIALIGTSHAELIDQDVAFVTGACDFQNQGRAVLMGDNRGKLHVYARKSDARILGAELIAPHGEHLAHLIAWTCACELGAAHILSMPFYHPVLEEGLRTAIRRAARQSDVPRPKFELFRCHDTHVG